MQTWKQLWSYWLQVKVTLKLLIYLVTSFSILCVGRYWWRWCWWMIWCCLPWWILFCIGGGIRVVVWRWIWRCSRWWWHAITCVGDLYTCIHISAIRVHTQCNQLPKSVYLFLNISLNMSFRWHWQAGLSLI